MNEAKNTDLYIPSNEELEEMDNILKYNNINSRCYNQNYDLYSYCLAKKIEIVLANGGLEFFGDDIKNDYQIVSKVIKYYKNDIWCTPFNNDIELAKQIISSNKFKPKIGLDCLEYLSHDLYKNNEFINSVIKELLEILRIYPEYRFEYKPNKLLEMIFGKSLSKEYLNSHYLDINHENILFIEPSYILDIDNSRFVDREFKYDQEITNLKKGNALALAIKGYATRYGIYNSYGTSDIKKEECKKLIKFLNDNNN